MNKLLQSSAFWLLAFISVFLLTQDYLFAQWKANTSFLGLPDWLFWLIGVHILFIILFQLFSKKYWRN